MNTDLMFSENLKPQDGEHDTPQDFYNMLDKEFHFDLDPCCTTKSQKAPNGFCLDKGQDGLAESWDGYKCAFMNPPYGRSITDKWVRKAFLESSRHIQVVGLIPGRIDTKWFHRYIWDDEINMPQKGIEFRPQQGRLIFGSDEYWEWLWEQHTIHNKPNSLYHQYGKKNAAGFPSMVIVWHPRHP